MIAFGRGSAGFVVINGSQDTVEHVLQTSLSAGPYCNRLVGGLCQEVVVEADGRLQARLAPMSALMVDIGFRPAD
ncbi:MAG: alpha amylase C-terminal domain-containing protein [Bacteroidetes bacterium]|nr:alpha amylase C-terminal domain-containing protein [Bacteroidota bacterium]MDA0875091.1 alpha amylase C-terminal domain-containing protein [Bacteroidota bacterium]